MRHPVAVYVVRWLSASGAPKSRLYTAEHYAHKFAARLRDYGIPTEIWAAPCGTWTQIDPRRQP